MPASEDEWSGSYETGVLSLSAIASRLLRCHRRGSMHAAAHAPYTSSTARFMRFAHFRRSIRIPSRPTWSWLSDCCTHAFATAQRPRSPHDRWLRFSCRAIFSEIATRLRHKGFADAGQSPPQLRGQGFPFFRLGRYRPVTSKEIRFKLNESTCRKLPCNAQTLHFFLNTDEDG
jgi:hypothetical protein